MRQAECILLALFWYWNIILSISSFLWIMFQWIFGYIHFSKFLHMMFSNKDLQNVLHEIGKLHSIPISYCHPMTCLHKAFLLTLLILHEWLYQEHFSCYTYSLNFYYAITALWYCLNTWKLIACVTSIHYIFSLAHLFI